jgi:hypothetical protein
LYTDGLPILAVRAAVSLSGLECDAAVFICRKIASARGESKKAGGDCGAFRHWVFVLATHMIFHGLGFVTPNDILDAADASAHAGMRAGSNTWHPLLSLRDARRELGITSVFDILRLSPAWRRAALTIESPHNGLFEFPALPLDATEGGDEPSPYRVQTLVVFAYQKIHRAGDSDDRPFIRLIGGQCFQNVENLARPDLSFFYTHWAAINEMFQVWLRR